MKLLNKSGVLYSETAYISSSAKIGEGTKVWMNAQIREMAQIGRDCTISKDVYIGQSVVMGDRCKVQNSSSIFTGVTLENEVFVGPNVCFTNDRHPRATNPNWQVIATLVKQGASIGANATIICGIEIGEYAMVAAGSVVTKDVKPYSLVMGNPARHYHYINKAGEKVDNVPTTGDNQHETIN